MRTAHGWGFISSLVLMGGISVVLAMVLLYGLLEKRAGRTKLEAARRDWTSKGLLQPIDVVSPPPSREAVENLERLLDALNPLRGINAAHKVYQFGPTGMVITEPGKAIPLKDQPAPTFEGAGKEKLPDSWDALRAEVAIAGPVLEKARDILKQPIGIEYEISGKAAGSAEAIQTLRALSCWLRSETAVKLHDGDVNGALDNLESIQRISAATGKSARGIVYIVLSLGIWAFGVPNYFWEGLQAENISEAELSRMQAIISGHDCVEWARRGMQIEMAAMAGNFEGIKSNSFPNAWCFVSNPTGWLGGDSALKVRQALWPRIWAEGDEAKTLNDYGRAALEAQEIMRKGVWDPSAFGGAATTTNYDLWRFPMGGTISGRDIIGPLLRSAVRAENRRQLILAAIGLKRFQLKTGHFPETLDELVPEILPALPHDWYDGKPLKYRRSGEGYLLYSVGEDGKDNGGNAEKAGKKPAFDSGPDVVWPRAE